MCRLEKPPWREDDCFTVVDMLGRDGCEVSTVGPSIVWTEMKSDRERIGDCK